MSGTRYALLDEAAAKLGIDKPRVLAISEDVMVRWRLLVDHGRKAGHTFSQPDLIIPATGLQHGLTLVSRDTSEFERARAPVVNPWRTT